jgi:CMP-N-acetylneuraminic acid synthetase
MVVWIQANVPIRKEGQIDAVIKKLRVTGADSVVTITPVEKPPQWMKRLNGDRLISNCELVDVGFRRQDSEPLYFVDGAVVAIRTDVLINTEGKSGVHVFMGDDVRGIVQERKYAIEVDEPDDLEIVTAIIASDQNF